MRLVVLTPRHPPHTELARPTYADDTRQVPSEAKQTDGLASLRSLAWPRVETLPYAIQKARCYLGCPGQPTHGIGERD